MATSQPGLQHLLISLKSNEFQSMFSFNSGDLNLNTVISTKNESYLEEPGRLTYIKSLQAQTLAIYRLDTNISTLHRLDVCLSWWHYEISSSSPLSRGVGKICKLSNGSFSGRKLEVELNWPRFTGRLMLRMFKGCWAAIQIKMTEAKVLLKQLLNPSKQNKKKYRNNHKKWKILKSWHI